MPTRNSTLSLSATAGLWHFESRDRALTRAVLAGAPCYLLARLYGLSLLRLHLIIRKTCARLRPDWLDDHGAPLAWSVPLAVLRAERETFGL